MIGVLEGFLQLLRLTPQAEALQHLSSTVPLLLAAVLRYHLLFDVLELVVGEVLHEHRLKHLQDTSSVYIGLGQFRRFLPAEFGLTRPLRNRLG